MRASLVWTTGEGHLVVFITVQNLVGIDAAVSIICMFFDFTSWLENAYSRTPKFFFGGDLTPYLGRHINETPKRHILGRKDVI